MIRITPLPLALCVTVALVSTFARVASCEPGWSVSSQGILASDTAPLTIRSPGGVFTIRIVPRIGDTEHFESDLIVTGPDGKTHRLERIRANGFFVSDAGRIVSIDRSDGSTRRTPLSVLDGEGSVLLQTEIDLLSDATLSGSRFAFRTPGGIELLDLDDLTITDYPPLGRFTIGPNGEVAGTDLDAPRSLRIFEDSGHEERCSIGLDPSRIAFSADGRSILAIDRHEFVRIAWASGLQERLLLAPEGGCLRDLRVTTDAIEIGVRMVDGDLYRGESILLSPDGTLLHRTVGQSRRIAKVEPPTHTRTTIPWPLQPNGQHPIGNTYGEYQNYGSSYLHPGVDIFGSPDQPMYAVEAGVVKAILTTAGEWHWRIAIGQPGTGTSEGYLYAHVNEHSIAVGIGDPVEVGQYLGDLVPWPIYDFTHVHFARIEDAGAQWYGSWLNTGNPHLDLQNQTETIPPIFEPARYNDLLAFCNNETSNYQSPSSLTGQVDIIAHVGETIESNWVCAVQEIRYTIYPLGNPGSPIVDDKLAVYFDMVLDTYQGGPIDPMLVDLLYKDDSTCNTQGDYDSREFYHIITNSNGDEIYDASDFDEAWDTTGLPDGDYVIEVTATDVAGNATTESMTVTTANGNPAGVESIDPSTALAQQSYPNPAVWGATVSFELPSTGPTELSIYDTRGRLVRTLISADLPAGSMAIDWDGRDANGVPAAPGVYAYRLRTDAQARTGKLTLVR